MRRPLALAACVLAASCGGPPEPPPRGASARASGPALDLLDALERAELRSDTLTWPLLRPSLAFDVGTWEGVAGETPVGLRSRRPVSRMWLPFSTMAEKEIRLRIRAGGAAGRSLRLALRLNRHALGELELSGEDRIHTLRLPAASQRPGPNLLELEVAGAAAREGRRGYRHFVLSGVEVAPADTPPATPTGDGLWLPAGAELSLYFRLEPGARLELAARAEGGPARLGLELDDGQGRRALLDLSLRTGDQVRRELDPPGGKQPHPARLVLSAAGPGLWIERLRLLPPFQAPSGTARLAGRPSVIVFLVDALRADALGTHGGGAEDTPRFDAFARDSLLFTRAQAQSSWTLPSVAALLTGRDPDALGVYGPWGDLDAETRTLAEAFGEAGYATGGFVANALLTRARGYAQGFSEWRQEAKPTSTGRPAAQVVQEALGWLKTQQGPVFLYAHVMEPHAPYGSGGVLLLELARKAAPRADDVRRLRAAYAEDVRKADEAFGALLDGLQQQGRLDDAIVVFLSDHGEEFFEHAGQGHGKTLYQEVVRIPLAVRLPRGGRVGRDATPIQHADVAPTLLALAGARPLPASEGRDLSALFAHARVPAPAVLTSRLLFERRSYDKVAASLGPLKLIVNEEEGAARPREMYDLEQDPGETRDVLAREPVAAGFLMAEVRTRRRRALAAGGGASRAEPSHDADARERLRALGYVQ